MILIFDWVFKRWSWWCICVRIHSNCLLKGYFEMKWLIKCVLYLFCLSLFIFHRISYSWKQILEWIIFNKLAVFVIKLGWWIATKSWHVRNLKVLKQWHISWLWNHFTISKRNTLRLWRHTFILYLIFLVLWLTYMIWKWAIFLNFIIINQRIECFFVAFIFDEMQLIVRQLLVLILLVLLLHFLF